MKPRIHPDSRLVVFRDRAADVSFLTRSTADSSRTIEWEDGRTYPVIDVEKFEAIGISADTAKSWRLNDPPVASPSTKN